MAQLLTRRNYLKGAGAAAIVVAGVSVWQAADSGMFNAGRVPAYELWTNWREAADPPVRLPKEQP